jgi:putative peptidoglycan lipid II flippase
VLIYPLHHLIFPRLGAAAHRGQAEIARVLARVAPLMITLAGLGAALLIGVGVPVARLLVLGPGSGDTWALAWPIIGYAPAVIGFALMGLATRTLYAEHRARPAGVTTVVAWGTVIIAVFVVRAVVPGELVVTGIALANSAGMIIGAVLGWILITTSRQQPVRLGMMRPAVRDLPIGIAVGALVAYPGRWLAEVGFAGALAGAVGAAAACVLLFAALVWLLDRRSVTGLLDLWRSRTPADRSTDRPTER